MSNEIDKGSQDLGSRTNPFTLSDELTLRGVRQKLSELVFRPGHTFPHGAEAYFMWKGFTFVFNLDETSYNAIDKSPEAMSLASQLTNPINEIFEGLGLRLKRSSD